MRKLVLITVIMFFCSCGVKYVPVSVQPIEETFEIKDQEKDLLFAKANTWFALAFQNSKNVIQYSDKETGVITGRFAILPQVSRNGYGIQQDNSIYSGIHVRLKDNGAKIVVSPDNFTEVHSSLNESYRFTKESAIAKSQELINSFVTYLKQPVDDF
ncbi:DUF4468 domain-containing protein [Gramella sp. KN1008]|uniref:DUF4468 domain-containing protein n=1 Tax=Gramella sp. KN1008 TaxID=2529298 RepID=UPI00103DFE28|nr:DUF4468 domain-containing protein [Gramella sp. KN1008]TBW28283.1 DUF4468 domain-containing protein [Gramella sp. KN1008]